MQQPKALVPLFLTELWERFGFYIVQGLLILYLTSALSFSDSRAYALLGAYTGLVYISPIIGGFIADRVLGYRNSIVLGAVLLCLGYAAVASMVSGLLTVGLALAITGNGFLKPNISSYLGKFYDDNDPRREAGFTYFYIGINLGGLFSTLSAGYIHLWFGWAITFACASVGLIIAIISFSLGFHTFGKKGLPVPKKAITPPWLSILQNKIAVGVLLIAMVALFAGLLKFQNTSDILMSTMGLVILGFLLWESFHLPKIDRNKMFALLMLIFIAILFWSLFFQLYSSTVLFIHRNVERHFFGINIPAIAFISLEPLFILLLGSVLARVWQRLHTTKLNPSLGVKFSIGLLLMSASFASLVLAIHFTGDGIKVHPLWMVLFYFLITLSELLVSPIGLSMITELAPQKLVGMMMGVWFLSLGFGGLLSGFLAKDSSVLKHVTDIHLTNTIYAHAFGEYALYALMAAAVMAALTPLIKRLT